MAKCKRVFFGTNSYGVSVEVAESETGAWYQRSYGFNGYGNSWGKWSGFAPSWSTSYVNVYTREIHQREEPALEYGFRILAEFKEVPRYKLPV